MHHLLLLVLTLTVFAQSKPASRAEPDAYVFVREVYDHVTKRSDVALPDELRVEFAREGKTIRLDLQRNKRININVPVTFAGGDDNDMIPDLQDVAVYQDLDRGAVISVRATPDVGNHKRKLEGSFGLGNRRYMISPVRDSFADMMSRLLRRNMDSNAEGLLHRVSRIVESEGKTKYSLHDHADFNNKIRSFDVRVGGRKLKLEMRQMEKRNNGDEIASYHVEILFVLDHTVWEYWMKKRGNERDAISSIKYFYSNIMNGIDLAYKTIDSAANHIMITPWLKGYYIAKTFSQSPWTTKSITSSATARRAAAIDGGNVLALLKKWATEDGRDWTNPDHAMLWTK